MTYKEPQVKTDFLDYKKIKRPTPRAITEAITLGWTSERCEHHGKDQQHHEGLHGKHPKKHQQGEPHQHLGHFRQKPQTYASDQDCTHGRFLRLLNFSAIAATKSPTSSSATRYKIAFISVNRLKNSHGLWVTLGVIPKQVKLTST